MHLSRSTSLACLTLITTTLGTSAGVVYPRQGLFDSSTGFMDSKLGRYFYRGSAVVARDPKLIYSCGHLFYEKGVWATEYNFYRAYDKRALPQPYQGVAPRGFRYFTNYSDNSASYGQNSRKAFAYDFTVFYGNNSFGPAVGWWQNGAEALKSNRRKRIVGYPSKIDYTGEQGYSYQHGTPWFTKSARQSYRHYYSFNNVSTGGGNSGGPVFIEDETGSNYYIGGILVSGSKTTAGIYALNNSSNNLASAALGQATSSLQFTNTSPGLLPDGGSITETRSTTVSGFSGTLSDIKVSLSVITPRRGDLDVYVRSPSGRIRWVNKQSNDPSADVAIVGADYASTFRGQEANGVWQVKIRDAVPDNEAHFNSFSVTVSAEVE